jgi:hypothetical protein
MHKLVPARYAITQTGGRAAAAWVDVGETVKKHRTLLYFYVGPALSVTVGTDGRTDRLMVPTINDA